MATLCGVTTEGERALSSSSTKTIIELMGAANVTAELVEFSFSIDGVTATDPPVLIELYQITATGTGTTLTELDLSRRGVTPLVTGKVANSVEPTKGSRIGCWECHPQAGMVWGQEPLGRGPIICASSTSQGLAFVYTTGAITPNITGYVWWEE